MKKSLLLRQVGFGAIWSLSTAVPAHAADAPSAPQTTAATTPATSDTAAAEKPLADDDIVVVGSRGVSRTRSESPVPVDVISAAQINAAGGSSDALRDSLVALVPSFLVNSVNNSAQLAVAKPAGLRGLGGAATLVLVNGKRRHNTAFPIVGNLTQSPNSNPVDLDQIPFSLIDRIEVLRDGAAAQYGSDAIAGVINIILKTSPSGGGIDLTAGRRSNNVFDQGTKGQQYQAKSDVGISLPGGGRLHVGLDYLHQEFRFLAKPSTQQFYPLVNGSPDPREATVNKTVFRGGLPKIDSIRGAYNLDLPLGSGTLYSFGTLGYRDPFVGQSYRLPNSTSYIDQIYNGQVVQPTGEYPEIDYQVALGIKGQVSGWSYDVSSTFGRDVVTAKVHNTLNPSLGPSSPTDFDQQRYSFFQWTNNLDISRGVEIGLAEPLNIAAGAEFRREGWKSTVLDAANYINGGYIYPSGPFAGLPAAPGGQGGYNTTPDEAANISRSVYAGYIDLAVSPVKGWDIGAALRYENYSDSSGDTISGKLTTRVAISPAIALRGAISNGFRAPSLSQEGMTFVSSSYQIVNGAVRGLTTLRLVKPESQIGQVLGATPLRPELSTSFSAGLVLTPFKSFTFTIDGYRISLRDRVVQTSYFSGAGVNAILAANNLPINQLVAYNNNAVDTRTTGLDAVLDYTQRLGDFGSIHWNLGLNVNDSKITRISATPAALQGLGLTLYDRQAQGYVTANLPKTKFIINPVLSAGIVTANVKLQRFGKVDLLAVSPAADQHYGAKWITDLDLAFAVTPSLKLAVGANNLFNVYPDRSTVPDVSGQQLYGSNSPFDFYGAFYYARINWRFK